MVGTSLLSTDGRGVLRRALALGLLALVTVVLALAATGCGDDSDESSSGGTGTETAATPADGAADAKAAVEELRAPVTFEPPGPAIDVGDQLEGKTIYAVVNGINFPFVQNLLAGMEEAAGELGMKVTAVDGAGQIGKAASLIQRGVSQKADAIVVQSFPAEKLAEPIKEAKAAGIPVIEATSRDAQLPPPEIADLGVEAIASYCYSCAATGMGATAIADGNGKVDAVAITSSDLTVSAGMVEALKAEFAERCEGCELEVVDSALANWGTQIPNLTSSAIRSNPNLTHFIPLFDSMVALMTPAMAQAGGEDIHIVSYSATAPVLELIAEGGSVIGDIGNSQHWLGWGTVDQAARLLIGEPALESEQIPERLFDSTNIGEIDIAASEDTWYGPDADFRAGYTELWGKQ